MSSDRAVKHTWDRMNGDQPMPKLSRRRVIGSKVMISEVRLQKGCVVPTHAHENEQMACVLSGKMRFTLGAQGATYVETLSSGEVLHLPANAPHGAEALEDSVVIDVFAPPSEKTGIDAPPARE